jgi:O-antigen/teichoic acid export membrane protein
MAYALFKQDIVLTGVNLATSVVVARALGPEALGIWIILQLIPSYAETFGRLKLDLASIPLRGTGEYREVDIRYHLDVFAVGSGVAIVGLGLFVLDPLLEFLGGGSDLTFVTLAMLMLFQVPFQFLLMNYTYALLYEEDVVGYNIARVGRALIFLLVTVVLLLVFEFRVLGVVVASLVSLLASLLYAAWRLPPCDGPPRPDRRLTTALFRQGIRFYLGGVVTGVNVTVAKLMSAVMLTPSNLAFFGMAQSQSQLLQKLPNALGTILFPRIARMGESESTTALAARAFRVTGVLMACACLAAAVCISPLVRILYGVEYAPLVRPFLIILPGVGLRATTSMLSQYFQGKGRADVLAMAGLPPLLIQILVGLWLIPQLHVLGAAVTFLLGLTVSSGLVIGVFVRMTGCGLGALVIRRADWDTVASFLRDLVRRRPAV